MMHLFEAFLFLLIADSLISLVQGQQCDVVVTSQASDIKAALKNLDVQVDGNISCSQTCDGIERKIDTLEAELGGKLNEVLDKKLNEILDKKLDALLDNITEQVGVILLQVNHLHLHGRIPSQPAASCADILHYRPGSPSGYYWIDAIGRQYCDMTRLCGGVTGGWMRVAYLDMTNSSHRCPSGLRQRTDSNKRTCVRGTDSAGCSSVTFSATTSGYSKVCGRVIAYQFFSTDAFQQSLITIDGPYVDGVSLTHGNPRHHLWTFAAAVDETGAYPYSSCPCTNTNTASQARQPPAFVGNDYFCDTGSAQQYQYRFYGDDPLWDGAGCGPLSTCCSFNDPPWFYKQLPQPTTDDVEMRVCRNSPADNEDIAIEIVEIYVQ